MGEPGTYYYRKIYYPCNKFGDKAVSEWFDKLEREAELNGKKFSMVYKLYTEYVNKPCIKYVGKSDNPVNRYRGGTEIGKGVLGQVRHLRKDFNIDAVKYCVIRGNKREKHATEEECIQYHREGEKENLKNDCHPETPSGGCPRCDRL